MSKSLVAANITKSYKEKEVLHNISLTIEPGKIYGLLGRNGAGKTTLLGILTGQLSHNSGDVTYGGEKVWENEKVLGEICFSRELSATTFLGQNAFSVKDYLTAAKIYYPHWDKDYAQRLIEKFGLKPKQKVYKMSKGMMSMLTIVIAMASMAPITILDEPVAGLDVVARELFYKLLIEDYTKTNRTFIISTHIIEEAANTLEEIILIDKGEIIVKENTQDFISKFHYIQGKDSVVDEASANLHIISSETTGRNKTICVKADFDDVEKAVSNCDVDVSPVPLQKIFVHLTEDIKDGVQ